MPSFYDRLNEILDRHHFDRCVEHLCGPYFHGPFGRASMTAETHKAVSRCGLKILRAAHSLVQLSCNRCYTLFKFRVKTERCSMSFVTDIAVELHEKHRTGPDPCGFFSQSYLPLPRWSRW